jgi:2-methylcitrate dehydratase PrpD
VNVIAAILELVAQRGSAPDDAERIIVEISKEAEAFHVFDSPTSRFEAMNSIPLSAATALLAGTFDQEHLEADWYAGDAVRSCMKERIQVSVSPELPSGSVRAFPIPLRSDRNVVEVHVSLGSEERPIGRSAIVDKFVSNVHRRLSAAQAADLADELLTLETVGDVSRILARVV